jgi:hypothetical protein
MGCALQAGGHGDLTRGVATCPMSSATTRLGKRTLRFEEDPSLRAQAARYGLSDAGGTSTTGACQLDEPGGEGPKDQDLERAVSPRPDDE